MCRAFFDFRAQCLKRGNAQESDVAAQAPQAHHDEDEGEAGR